MNTSIGFSGDGLPIGLTLMGPADSEMHLFSSADAFEELTDWHRRAPGWEAAFRTTRRTLDCASLRWLRMASCDRQWGPSHQRR